MVKTNPRTVAELIDKISGRRTEEETHCEKCRMKGWNAALEAQRKLIWKKVMYVYVSDDKKEKRLIERVGPKEEEWENLECRSPIATTNSQKH